MTIRTLRMLLLIDIASLILVGAIHAGALGGPFEQASMYEAAVAVILAIGLALTFAAPAVARWGAFVAQLIALFGVGTGIYMALNGMAPNTMWDYAYHAIAVVLLVAGLWGALRLRAAEPADAQRVGVGSYRRGPS
jgi:hypothetical protein